MATLIGGPSTHTLSSTELTQGKAFGLGDKATDHKGAEYRYVKAGSAITQYDTVWIDETFTANPITAALAATTGQVGSAQVAFASAAYGWVAVAGANLTSRVAANTTADATLWTSDAAGVLTSAASTASHFPIFGLEAASAASAGGVTNVAAFMAYPVVAKATGL